MVPLAPREIYYGYGHYGRHSINITKVNIRNIKVTNVYLNTRVSHAVTVVHHDTFTRGKHFNVGNAPANPFLAGLRVSTGRPAIKQINYSALPLKVVQRKNLPAKDNKRTEELGRRNVALNKNISVFKQTKPVTPMSVNVIRDRKSNSLDKDLQQSRPKTNPQISKQAKRQEAGTTVLSGNSVRRVEPRSFPQVNNQAKRQEPRTATPSSSIIRPLEPRTDPQVSKQARPPKSGISNPPSKTVHRPEPGTVPQVKQAQRQESGNNSAQDNIQPRRQESKPAPNLSKNEKHEQRKEKKI